MTPGARIQAAIELLGRIEAAPVPAERIVTAYHRERRYIGSKDRRAIGDLVYAILRGQARLDWWLDRVGAGQDDAGRPRRVVLAALVLIEGRGAEELAGLFDGGAYAPAPLEGPERALVDALSGRELTDRDQPPWIAVECPEWLWPEFEAGFGAAAADELAASIAPASLDLRVNTLKGDRAAARAALAEEGIAAVPTPLSPLGLRVVGRPGLSAGKAFESGLVEVQDEGSQLVAIVTDARPGMAVADFCAGAGGKTLALAAAMGNEGPLSALDTDQRRLDQAARRIKRAGARNVTRQRLVGEDWLAHRAGVFARVLVDAPCSGSGAWRRQPDARWRLSPEKLAGYRRTQARILAQAAPVVAGGGRLVYATCSLLPSENEAQVAAFLDARPDFAVLPMDRIWAETIAPMGGPAAPEPTPFSGPFLQLTPARHGCDGFFAAAFERRKRT
ncbi:MAG: RsmB/NOP family class I SAM-dependent RNA methyltransferase [Proteobacteria bacterium]|nr:RsmB/NOP family class I SAM-dependent RNA methyltransferase [Pseudomonadota bacterium]